MTLEALEKAKNIQKKMDDLQDLRIAFENIDEFRLTPRTTDTMFDKVYLNYLPGDFKTGLVETVKDLIEDYTDILKKELESL